jgi:hypothetical protein
MLSPPTQTNVPAKKNKGKTLRALFPKPLSLLEIHQEKKKKGQEPTTRNEEKRVRE